MSMQRAQGVLLFLVRFNNSARFEIHEVTRSSSSCPFLCALDVHIIQPHSQAFAHSTLAVKIIVLLATNGQRPGNEPKHSPHGKIGGWRAVLCH